MSMARRLRFLRALRRLIYVQRPRRELLIEAALWLLISRLALTLIPFPRLAQRVGTLVSPTDTRTLQASAQGPRANALLAEEIGWAVTRAAYYLPFKAACLPQALAARFMLKRRRIQSVLHFGVAKGEAKSLDAHAWLEAEGVEVTGYPVVERYAQIGCFV
jgi:hypothetical protein